MNARYIEEQQVLTRYLAGQLSDAERDAFEAHYVEHPEVLQELELAAKLKLGLGLLQDCGELEQPAPRRQYWWRGLAAAALLFIAVAVTLWFATPTREPSALAATLSALAQPGEAPPPLADTYIIERTRSRGVDAKLVLPSAPQAIALRVLPEHPASLYRVQLNVVTTGAAPRQIADLRGLRVDAEGLVAVYVRAGQLQPGSYELIVSNDADTQLASPFLILVEPAGGRR